MALRFIDGFEGYAFSEITRKWTTVIASGGLSITSSGGRNGTASFKSDGDAGSIAKTLDAQATWIIGMALKHVNNSVATSFFALMDNADVQVYWVINVDGTISCKRGGDNVTLGTSSFALASNTYYYIELKATINNSTGSFETRVNGVNRSSGSSLDTQNTSNASANRFALGNPVTGWPAHVFEFDDFYACDSTGSANNDFLGDVRVQAIRPTGAGNYAQWTRGGTDSGANWSQVDETSSNDDTDYVSSSTANQIDSYAFGDITAGSVVKGVQVCLLVRKDDGGVRTVAPFIRQASTDYAQTNVNVNDTYSYLMEVEENDPNTGVAWTAAGVNSAEYGVKMIA